MTLSDHTQMDLHKLTLERIEQAINSMVQLLDNDQQVAHLMLAILANLTDVTAEHMHDSVIKPDGSQPTRAECVRRVLSMIAATQNLARDDIEKLGLEHFDERQ